MVNTKDLDDIQVYQSITVHGMVLFGDNKAEPLPNKTDLLEKEGSFVDECGSIPITIWNKQIGTGVTDTAFNKLTENLPLIPQRKIKDTKEEIKTNEITCDHIQSVDITVFYNCVKSAKKSNFKKNKLNLGLRTAGQDFSSKILPKLRQHVFRSKKKLCKQYGIH